ncbi:helix-turn-helix transcriptional regulator [Clostridium sp. MB40-C1]|uniref:helix-turn-helix domain-containing protein n=1 Tax=Clostridium sp. MB40-C1 TaxID=3070996 RepID=UPI0027E18080|nr:helix-turn-helix transcriptional regulator [Clostridium sp. MB40-C1]WMJ81465.1 helix-turn-helix transcriptional regulator [Clostridium sp. MB40-C1]
MNTLGKEIAYLRKKEGLSQRKLMDLLEFENLHKYEKDLREPNLTILKKLALHFNVSVDWLLVIENATINFDLNANEVKLIENIRKLSDVDKIKFEGMIELKLAEMQD